MQNIDKAWNGDFVWREQNRDLGILNPGAEPITIAACLRAFGVPDSEDVAVWSGGKLLQSATVGEAFAAWVAPKFDLFYAPPRIIPSGIPLNK